MIKTEMEFNRDYGKSYFSIDKFFLYCLIFTNLFTIAVITFLATRDYSKLQTEHQEKILNKYIATITRLKDFEVAIPEKQAEKVKPISGIIVPRSRSFEAEVKAELDRIDRESATKGVLGIIRSTEDYSDLPEVTFEDILDINDIIAEKTQMSRRYDLGPDYDYRIEPTHDFETGFSGEDYTGKITRKGAIYLDPTETIKTDDGIARGWRDPEEITIKLNERESLIKYCYQKTARNYNRLSGYVIVRFVVLSSGSVDPGSVRITESTLYNKEIERCIKSVIKRMRGFEKLDDSMGNVAVVQKYLFN